MKNDIKQFSLVANIKKKGPNTKASVVVKWQKVTKGPAPKRK